MNKNISRRFNKTPLSKIITNVFLGSSLAFNAFAADEKNIEEPDQIFFVCFSYLSNKKNAQKRFGQALFYSFHLGVEM